LLNNVGPIYKGNKEHFNEALAKISQRVLNPDIKERLNDAALIVGLIGISLGNAVSFFRNSMKKLLLKLLDYRTYN